MSTNIKVNPFSIAGNWNNAGLDFVIAALPGSPSPEDVVNKVSIYLSTKMYNAAIYADIDVGCHAFLPPRASSGSAQAFDTAPPLDASY